MVVESLIEPTREQEAVPCWSPALTSSTKQGGTLCLRAINYIVEEVAHLCYSLHYTHTPLI